MGRLTVKSLIHPAELHLILLQSTVGILRDTRRSSQYTICTVVNNTDPLPAYQAPGWQYFLSDPGPGLFFSVNAYCQ